MTRHGAGGEDRRKEGRREGREGEGALHQALKEERRHTGQGVRTEGKKEEGKEGREREEDRDEERRKRGLSFTKERKECAPDRHVTVKMLRKPSRTRWMPQLGAGRGAIEGLRVSVGNRAPLPALSSLLGTEEKSISVLIKPLYLYPPFFLLYFLCFFSFITPT